VAPHASLLLRRKVAGFRADPEHDLNLRNGVRTSPSGPGAALRRLRGVSNTSVFGIRAGIMTQLAVRFGLSFSLSFLAGNNTPRRSGRRLAPFRSEDLQQTLLRSSRSTGGRPPGEETEDDLNNARCYIDQVLTEPVESRRCRDSYSRRRFTIET